MKKVIFIIASCIFGLNLNAQSLEGLSFSDGSATSPSIWFRNGIANVLFLSQEEIDVSAKYTVNVVNNIYHVVVLSEPRIELYLLFDNEYGYFSLISPFRADSGILVNITEEKASRLPRGGGDSFISAGNANIKTSSFLKEGRREYTGNNMTSLFRTDPWVEGKKDAGIGEYIEFDFSNADIKETDTIVMSNGFFSHDNPNLYHRNNRVKRIKIEDVNGKYSQEFDVKDTPNLQSFRMSRFCSKIKITILDVYYGTEFNDTCINYLNGVKIKYIER